MHIVFRKLTFPFWQLLDAAVFKRIVDRFNATLRYFNYLMKKATAMIRKLFSLLSVLFLIFGCSDDAVMDDIEKTNSPDAFLDSASGSETASDFGDGAERGSSSTQGSGNGTEGEAGLVTAAEWNDLDRWSFWTDLLSKEEFSKQPDYWSFYNENRISALLTNTNGTPAYDIPIKLVRNENTIWETRTDNFGKAELFIGLKQRQQLENLGSYQLFVDGQASAAPIKTFDEGINELGYGGVQPTSDKVELGFVVDATGSMADELEFLKKDLQEVIARVENEAPHLDILTGSVFYRDVGDDYVVRHSGFSNDIEATLSFIKAQRADGGGDFPEAVHTALGTALNELQWSNSAKTRIMFLLLDAPPHYGQSIIDDLHVSIEKAAKNGIKLIPVTASGIDKDTEFLMRFFSITTNGTYVFITDDSGIGNDHLEPSVGQYEVEKLNDLMVRLILKYSGNGVVGNE